MTALEREIAAALQGAEALLRPSSLRWLEDAPLRLQWMDLTAALEALLRQSLESGSEVAPDEPPGVDGLPLAARVPPPPFHLRRRAPAMAPGPSPPAPPTRPPAPDQGGRPGPPTATRSLRAASAPRPPVADPSVADPSGADPSVADPSGADPSVAPGATPGPRLITTLPELQSLFRAVVAEGHTQAGPPASAATETNTAQTPLPSEARNGGDRPEVQEVVPSAPNPPSFPDRVATSGTFVSRDDPASVDPPAAGSSVPPHTPGPDLATQRWDDVASMSVPAPSEVLPDRTSPVTSRAALDPYAALTQRTPFPDPAWEEVLFERLLDRWEERLREQTIRHLGFTGGQV